MICWLVANLNLIDLFGVDVLNLNQQLLEVNYDTLA